MGDNKISALKNVPNDRDSVEERYFAMNIIKNGFIISEN